MDNLIIVLILAIIIGLAVTYIIKAKKRGSKCIGCPYGDACQINGSPCSGKCYSGNSSESDN